MRLLRRLDGLVLNDSEARLLTNDENLVRAGHKVREMGPKFVVIKKGEHGAMFFSEHETYVMPAYPTPDVIDPTGAGDSFAGGFMGYLASAAAANHTSPTARMRRAMIYGSVMGSFAVERFGVERLQNLTRAEIADRYTEFRQLTRFD